MTRKIAVLGGDRRMIAATAFLLKRGYEPFVFGIPAPLLPPGAKVAELPAALSDAVAAMLPLPAFKEGELFCPLLPPETRKPKISELGLLFPSGALLAGGMLPESSGLFATNHTFFDYAKDDVFQEKNATPTAEGTLEILMKLEERTLSGLPLLVVGFGRVGKALGRLLRGCNAQVTVAARREEALKEAAGCGYGTLLLDDPDRLFAAVSFAAVLNTVPAPLFSEEILLAMGISKTPLIDLSSAPGCVKGKVPPNVTVIRAPGLPGKYAPVSAGEILAECVLSHLERREET